MSKKKGGYRLTEGAKRFGDVVAQPLLDAMRAGQISEPDAKHALDLAISVVKKCGIDRANDVLEDAMNKGGISLMVTIASTILADT